MAAPLFLKILIFAYAGVGIIGVVAYLPTIKDLLRQKLSANTSSYAIWALSTLITFLYAVFILPDFWFIVISALNFLCCAVILILCLAIKYFQSR